MNECLTEYKIITILTEKKKNHSNYHNLIELERTIIFFISKESELSISIKQ
jgi:hypothetical protein